MWVTHTHTHLVQCLGDLIRGLNAEFWEQVIPTDGQTPEPVGIDEPHVPSYWCETVGHVFALGASALVLWLAWKL